MVVGVCLARVCGRLCLLFLLGRWRGGVVLVEACSFGVCVVRVCCGWVVSVAFWRVWVLCPR